MNNKTNKRDTGDLHNCDEVLAYRVGELEKASRQGFKEIGERLEIMSTNFATHKDIQLAKEQAKVEHNTIYADLEVIRDDVQTLKEKSWMQNSLSAVFGAVLALLTAYAFNGIFK